MKKYLSIFILLLIGFCKSYSQVEPVSERVKVSGFGSVKLDVRNLHEDIVMYSGGGGGFLINQFRIGVFFEGLSSNFTDNSVPSGISTSQGGLWFVVPFISERKYHPSIDIKINYGDIRFMDTNIQIIDNADFLGFCIGLGFEYRISDLVFLNSGIKYGHNFFLREFDDPTLFENFNFEHFNYFSIYTTLKIGSFFH